MQKINICKRHLHFGCLRVSPTLSSLRKMTNFQATENYHKPRFWFVWETELKVELNTGTDGHIVRLFLDEDVPGKCSRDGLPTKQLQVCTSTDPQAHGGAPIPHDGVCKP